MDKNSPGGKEKHRNELQNKMEKVHILCDTQIHKYMKIKMSQRLTFFMSTKK